MEDKHKVDDKMSEAQKAAYLEAYMAQQAAALQQQNKFRYEAVAPSSSAEDKKKSGAVANGSTGKMFGGPAGSCGNYGAPLKVPQLQPGTEPFKSNLETTFTVPDDGLGYDDGVRVLRTLGSWTPEYPGLSSRSPAGMLFPDLPYPHTDMSLNQRKIPTTVLPTSLPAPQPLNTLNTAPLSRPTPTLAASKKESHQGQQHSGGSKVNGVTSTVHNSNKSFTCTICGKSLARKDKLVIHTRIHTGEKPYVCEVCDKAFARRDKLVIHMNKMKHRTPTNIAPLGKRSNPEKAGPVKKLDEPEEIPKTAAMSLQSAAANWSCELCGQVMTTREEWMLHAKAHLEEKITGIGVISQSSFPSHQRSLAPYHVQAGGYGAGPYAASHFSPERQYCPVCRQTFTSKSDFMVHVRAHFDNNGKSEEDEADHHPHDNSSQIDNTMCS